jgi:quinol monooxygenase YgiN
VLDERYIDKAAVAAHRETPHLRDYFRKINDLAERTALVPRRPGGRLCHRAA